MKFRQLVVNFWFKMNNKNFQILRWYIGKNHLSGVKDPNLNLKLRKEMHMKTVTCEASNTVASVKASIQLNILCKMIDQQQISLNSEYIRI